MIDHKTAPYAILALRLTTGALFLFHGLVKVFVFTPAGTVGYFESIGLPGALGAIEPARLNIDGGAVALGHPVGASGVRIVLHLLQALRRTGGKRGIATICIGGGLGGAMLVEAL